MPSPRGLVQWVDQELHRSAIIPRGARLLLAISGGADSVALLRLMLAINGSDYWKWTLIVGHVDHGIRGEESAADARWVAELARESGLTCAQKSLSLHADISEEKARLARHAVLGEMAAEYGCAGYVMAHHADDQAETMLMRMFRGCGIDGLRAMADKVQLHPLENGPILWRPLLQVRRAQLRQYLGEIGQQWREDKTNASTRYARNRVRAELFPVIEELWPGAVDALGRLSRIAGESHQILEAAAEEFMNRNKLSWRDPNFPRNVLRTALPGLVGDLLRYTAALKFGVDLNDYERISEAVRLIQGTHGAKEIELGSGILVVIEGELVRIIFRKPARREA